MSASEVSLTSLSNYLSDASHGNFREVLEEPSVETFFTEEEALCISMERLFKHGLRRPLFKVFFLFSIMKLRSPFNRVSI
jgi:hypothetical protein